MKDNRLLFELQVRGVDEFFTRDAKTRGGWLVSCVFANNEECGSVHEKILRTQTLSVLFQSPENEVWEIQEVGSWWDLQSCQIDSSL